MKTLKPPGVREKTASDNRSYKVTIAWREFSKLITAKDKGKPKQSWIAFDTQLEIA